MGFKIFCFDERKFMLIPIIFLIVIRIIGGSFFRWLVFPFLNLIVLSKILKFLTLIVCLIGGLMGYFFFNKNVIILKNIKFNFFFFNMIYAFYFFLFFKLFYIKFY